MPRPVDADVRAPRRPRPAGNSGGNDAVDANGRPLGGRGPYTTTRETVEGTRGGPPIAAAPAPPSPGVPPAPGGGNAGPAPAGPAPPPPPGPAPPSPGPAGPAPPAPPRAPTPGGSWGPRDPVPPGWFVRLGRIYPMNSAQSGKSPYLPGQQGQALPPVPVPAPLPMPSAPPAPPGLVSSSQTIRPQPNPSGVKPNPGMAAPPFAPTGGPNLAPLPSPGGAGNAPQPGGAGNALAQPGGSPTLPPYLMSTGAPSFPPVPTPPALPMPFGVGTRAPAPVIDNTPPLAPDKAVNGMPFTGGPVPPGWRVVGNRLYQMGVSGK